MTRRKVAIEEKLSQKIGLRVSISFYKKMEGWCEQSNVKSVAELARRILYKEEIVWYHKDARFDETVLELTKIRKDLNAIGNNINQITRSINTTDNLESKTTEAKNVTADLSKMEVHLQRVVELIEGLSKQWLQK